MKFTPLLLLLSFLMISCRPIHEVYSSGNVKSKGWSRDGEKINHWTYYSQNGHKDVEVWYGSFDTLKGASAYLIHDSVKFNNSMKMPLDSFSFSSPIIGKPSKGFIGIKKVRINSVKNVSSSGELIIENFKPFNLFLMKKHLKYGLGRNVADPI